MAPGSLGRLSPADFYNPGAPPQVVTGLFKESRPTGLHPGVDISSRGPDGLPVPQEFVTPVGGEVSVKQGSHWNAISIIQPDGYTIQFLHASEVYDELNGQVVPPGTPLGITGNTDPRPVPVHLHVQVWTPAGQRIDPGWFFDAPPDYPRTARSQRKPLDLEYHFTVPGDNPFQLSALPSLLLPVVGAVIGAAVSSLLALPLETPSEILRLAPDWECEKLLTSTMPSATLPLALATGVIGPIASWALRKWNAGR